MPDLAARHRSDLVPCLFFVSQGWFFYLCKNYSFQLRSRQGDSHTGSDPMLLYINVEVPLYI